MLTNINITKADDASIHFEMEFNGFRLTGPSIWATPKTPEEIAKAMAQFACIIDGYVRASEGEKVDYSLAINRVCFSVENNQ